MKRIAALCALLVLGACGADGEPVQPSMNTNIGVGTNGVSASTGLRVKKGPFSLGWGVGL
ncbi:MAG: hypothetical protein RIG84_17070 [Roseovarius sp.]